MDADKELIVDTSLTTPFAFTLRKTKQPVTRADYENKFHKIERMGCVITDHVYEYESGIHMHGIVQIPKTFNFKLLRTRGWILKLDELYDHAGWLAYITKQHSLILPKLPVEVYQDLLDQPDPDFKMPKVKLF